MGLCKCPRKKVTNQFCFEHRVNVCEHCMVSNHPKCVVQSYLQWLQDSDYSPLCELCQKELSIGDCIRLICYHVFHVECLDEHARSLPPNTAPAGYMCPSCKTCVFPTTNTVSPVADNLRAVLAHFGWARVGCGLPMIDPPKTEDENVQGTASHLPEASRMSSTFAAADSVTPPSSPRAQWSPSPSPCPSEISSVASSPSTRVDMSNNQFNRTDTYSSIITGVSSPRRLYDATETDSLAHTSFDHDENKYKRRSAIEWFSRWFRSYSSSKGRHDPHRRFKRCVVLAVLLVIAFLTLVMIFVRLGRATADDDPFLDPMANPNIRVQDQGNKS